MVKLLQITKIVMVVMAIVAAIPLIYFSLFPPHELYCVVNRNGELVKAWDADCKTASVVGPVLTHTPE